MALLLGLPDEEQEAKYPPENDGRCRGTSNRKEVTGGGNKEMNHYLYKLTLEASENPISV